MRTTRNSVLSVLHGACFQTRPARRWLGGVAGLLLFVVPGAWAQVHAINAGDIVAANYRAGGSTVVRVNPQTGAVRRLGLFNNPTDVAISPDGFLYVSELGGLIKRVNLTNGVETVVNPNTTLSLVWGLALGPDGDLYVTASSSDRIVRLNPTSGSETNVAQGGQMSVPTGIDFLDAGHVVVASRGNNRVVSVSLLDQTQTVLAQGANGIDSPWGISVFNGNIYVGAHDSKLLFRITGTTVTNILPAWSPQLGGGPYGIGTDANGNIVIGVSGGLVGPFALEQRDPQGIPLPTFSGSRIGEITGVEVSRISVVAENQFNTAPELPVIGELMTDESSAMAFSADGTDSDWPLQELTYSLVGAVPPGAALSANGVFTWKPTEAQGPSTNTFTLVVTDDGMPSLSTTQIFTVVVNELNTPPVVTAVSDKVSAVGSLLSFKVNATDADLPSQSLTFSLEPDPPLGASITTNGDFTWTPGAIPGPGDYVIGVIVTDSAEPPLSDTNHFMVSVREVNVPPVFGVLTNRVVDEATLLSFQIAAADSNQPPQSLTFSFVTNGPNGAAISSAGLFTWAPSEAQGPSTNIVAVRVTDDGVPPLSATNTFTIVVREVNRSPVLDPIVNQSVNAGDLLTFKITATDPDLPAQKLAFGLATGAPAGATITAAGTFSWALDPAEPAGTHVITAIVTDDGSPPLTNSRSFTVEVHGGFTVNVGDIIVADFGADSVVKIDRLTGTSQSLGTFPGPTDVVLATNGMLYVAEQGGAIERLDLRTGAISLINSNSGLYDLRSIVIGPAGELYVTTGWDDGIVRVDPSTGTDTLVTQGDLISGPFGIAMLDPKHLIVSSYFLDRIVAVALTNHTQYLVAEGNGISQPFGLATSGGSVLLVSWGNQTVQSFANGALTDLVTLPDSPCGIGVALDGTFAVSVSGTPPRIDCFSPSGGLLTNYQAGLTGYCMGVEVAAFSVGVTPVPNLEWSEWPGGPYGDETSASVDPASKTVTAPLHGNASFYRLRAAASTRIVDIRVANDQVMLRYEP